MALENEVVAKNDPEEEPEAEAEDEPEEEVKEEEEEEDEEDLIDPADEIREKCEGLSSSKSYLQKLDECNNRVNSRSKTDENCHEEMMDWVHAVDHCVAKTLFSKLK